MLTKYMTYITPACILRTIFVEYEKRFLHRVSYGTRAVKNTCIETE